MACVIGMITSHAGWVYPKQKHLIHGGGQALSLGKHFHISLEDGSIVFYNSDNYGPYRGSMLSMGFDPDAPTVNGFGMWAGIYLRDIRWPNGDRLWTLFVTLWYPVIIFGLGTTAYEYRRFRIRQNGIARDAQRPVRFV